MNWTVYLFSDSGKVLWKQDYSARDEREAERVALRLVKPQLSRFDDADDWVFEPSIGRQANALTPVQRVTIAARVAGMFKGLPAMPQQVWRWLQPKIAGHYLAVVQARMKEATTPAQDKELKSLSSMLKQSARRSKFIKGIVSGKFEIDPMGWAYIDKFTDKQFSDMWGEYGDLLRVKASFKDATGDSGYFDFVGDGTVFGDLMIDVFAPTYSAIRLIQGDVIGAKRLVQKSFDFIEDTIRHELEHMSQEMLKELTKIHNAGNPGTKHQGPLSDPESIEDENDYKSFEFYPRLKDDVLAFSRHLQDVPESRWRSELDRWSKDRSTFLGLMYQQDKKRWRKAVAEFVKELGSLGVKLASAQYPDEAVNSSH